MAKTRALLVGCGGISRAWLRPVLEMPEVELAALVDIMPEAAQQLAEEFGLQGVPTGTDLEHMLERTAPDVVFNCTVPEAHAAVTLAALRHGCHVLGEKPLADSLENAARMLAAAEEAGRILAVIQNRRYDARIRRLRHFIASGVLGPVTTVNCDFFIGAHFGGFRDHMEHVLLLDMAIHTFDQARLLTGADPVSVYCHEWNPAGSWYDHDASAVAIFEMTGGIVFTYRGSWCAEGLNTTWEADWRIICERGSVRWDGADGFWAQAVSATGTFLSALRDVAVPPFDAGDKVGGHAGNIREFVRCVREGGTPETVASDNIKSLAMVFAAIESAREGKRLRVTF
ncbi:MAG: Gfo/Idh/MocA family oxidoreductase [Anaerolineae bacterium]|nr:Gfo/Idh/MocA family oxidoreductase [Anaerolineae bacterium]